MTYIALFSAFLAALSQTQGYMPPFLGRPGRLTLLPSTSITRLHTSKPSLVTPSHKSHPTRLQESTGSSGEEKKNESPSSNSVASTAQKAAVELKEQATRARLEADRVEAKFTLEKVNVLEKQLENANDNKQREDIRQQILALSPKINKILKSDDQQLSSGDVIITEGSDSSLTEQELKQAVALYKVLPQRLQQMLRRAVVKSYNSNVNMLEPVNTTDIVLKLYSQRENLLKYPSSWVRQRGSSVNNTAGLQEGSIDSDENFNQLLQDLKGVVDQAGDDTSELQRFVESYFPDVTRKGEGYEPTEQDADIFITSILGKGNFNPKRKPEKIPGGFVIRGASRFETGEDLINAIDLKIGQYVSSAISEEGRTLGDRVEIFYCKDPTPEAMEDMEELWGEAALVLLGKDFAPTTNRFLNIGVSTLALGGLFVFSIGCFGTTDAVVQRLQNANALENYDPSWFNTLLFPLCGSLMLTQLAHELGHVLAAWQGKVSNKGKKQATPDCSGNYRLLETDSLLLFHCFQPLSFACFYRTSSNQPFLHCFLDSSYHALVLSPQSKRRRKTSSLSLTSRWLAHFWES